MNRRKNPRPPARKRTHRPSRTTFSISSASSGLASPYSNAIYSSPSDLVKAHAKLDKLVEKAYGKSSKTDAERVAILFERYQKLTVELFAGEGEKKNIRRSEKKN
jgi:hypothetical protein